LDKGSIATANKTLELITHLSLVKGLAEKFKIAREARVIWELRNNTRGSTCTILDGLAISHKGDIVKDDLAGDLRGFLGEVVPRSHYDNFGGYVAAHTRSYGTTMLT
jgi:hypothetical protein